MAEPKTTHVDYAEEAEAAQRAEAWPQAAALWRRAADALRASAPHTTETFDLHAKYQVAAERVRRPGPGSPDPRTDRPDQAADPDAPRAKIRCPRLPRGQRMGPQAGPAGRLRGGPRTMRSNPCFPFSEGAMR